MHKLKLLRLERKLKQSDVAKVMGVAQPTYSGWETGKMNVDRDNLIKLADFFNVSIDYLLDRPKTNKETPTQELNPVTYPFPPKPPIVSEGSQDKMAAFFNTVSEDELMELCKSASKKQLEQIKNYAKFILAQEGKE